MGLSEHTKVVVVVSFCSKVEANIYEYLRFE